MKCFFPLLFSFLVLSTGIPSLYNTSDSLKINSVGVNNSVVIDTLNSKILSNDSLSFPLKGKISQNGENNAIEIQTSLNLNILSNDSLSFPLKGKISQNGINNSVEIQTSIKNTNNISTKHSVKIKQSGKNNSVKIKSR
jgi:hypothetical protein